MLVLYHILYSVCFVPTVSTSFESVIVHGVVLFLTEKNQACGAGAGGAEIILDLEPEPNYLFVSLKDARMKKN